MKTKVIVELADFFLKVGIGKKIAVEPIANNETSEISAALNRILAKNKSPKGLDVYCVLSRNKLTVRRVDLPSQEPKEIEQMLGLYLMRQIPYHKEDVVWAYQNLGFDGISNSHLILAIALKNVFKNLVSSFGSINILPESILMSSQGIIYYVNEAVKDKSAISGSYLVLDVDSNYSDLLLVHNQKLGSSLVIPQGIDQLKNEQDRERFIVELKQGLVALSNEIPEAKYEKLFLTGASAELLTLVESGLSRDFNLKAQYVSLKEYENFISSGIRNVSLSAVLGFNSQVSKDDIRFVVPELQIKKEMKSKVQQLMVLGVCLIYILLSLGGIGLVRLIQRQFYASHLKNQVANLSKNAKELDNIVNKLKIARQYSDPKSSAASFLYELNRLVPDSITVTNYNWELRKNLTIRGYAQQIPDILAFTGTLSNSALFKGAQNRYTRRRKLKDKDVVDFEIVVK